MHHLRFDEDVNISIEANIEHRTGETIVGRSESRRQDVTSLIKLLGTSIDRVSLEEPDTVVLMFQNADVLRLYSDDLPYEAFTISARPDCR